MRDRTSDYQEFIQSKFPQKVIAARSARTSSPFTVNSIKISKDLQNIQNKIVGLEKLVEKNTLFDDPTQDIQDITTIIKQEIDRQKRAIELLTKMKNANNNKQTQTHFDVVLYSLNARLADIAKQFKNALSKRSEKTKEQKKRLDVLTGSPADPALRQRKRLIEADSPMLPGPSYQDQSGGVVIPMPGKIQENIFAHVNRSTAVEKIETILVDIQSIFVQFASVVSEQGEALDRIDAQVYASSENISKSQSWLLKYQQKLTSNRGFILKLFAALALVITLVMVFYR